MKKSTKFILYFCLTLFLLNSCTTEKEFVEKNNSTKQYSIKEYTAKEADNLVKFQAIKQRIVKNLMNMSNNESSREVLGFTVDDSMMKEISTTNYSSYNMLILRNVPTTDYFENLVIEQKSDTINAYVVKYTPSSTSNLFDGGFDGTIEASKVYGQTCIVCPGSGESGSDGDGGGFSGLGGGNSSSSGVVCTTIFMCNRLDPLYPSLPMPHVSYSDGCQNIPVITCSTMYTPSSLGNGGASTGSNTGPGNGALHGGSGSNSGATTPNNNPIVLPVLPTLEQTINNFVLSLSPQQQLWWNNPINSDCVNQIKAFLSKDFPKIALEDFEFANWAVTYLMANTNVTAQQFKNWFMVVSEGVDGEYDSAYWENPSLTFQQQTLPTYNTFFTAYPKNVDGTWMEGANNVYSFVGGAVQQARITYPNGTDNTCALKVSIALNGSGIIIPNIPGQTLQGGGQFSNKYFFLNARALNKWVRKTFGTTTNPNYVNIPASQITPNGENLPTLLANVKGIYSLVCPVGSTWASGHADIINNAWCAAGCHFPDAPIEYIDVWKLN